ncbi:MAG: rhodanese-like domain-containing protein [Saprospiraceae bacterium]
MQIMKFVATVAIVLVAFSCQSQQTKSNAPAATTVSQSTSVPTGSPFTNVDVAGFKQLMGGNDVVVLDVRTPQETAMGMIEGAIQINVMDPLFSKRLHL